MTIEQAQAELADAVKCRRRCFFSTPNLNFLIACLRDALFRDSVIRSDLSFADGMPVIWIARVLGIPVRTRVAGSTLFERLREQVSVPIRVFFFGGQDGVALQAGEVINTEQGKMQCVGSCSPGFGSIEDLSSGLLINEINAARTDFLLVALGAKRGQAWIEHNLASLDAPVVSHLGAVVNFVAGTVSRSPGWIGDLGLEWIWRIKEEPMLWRRYMGDGFALLNLLLTRVIPAALSAARLRRTVGEQVTADLSVVIEGNNCRIALTGNWNDHNLFPLRDILQRVTTKRCHILLDIGKVTHLDSACLGLFILLFGHQSKIKHDFGISAAPPFIKRIFKLNCAEYLLEA
jgi:N-acetylglucosaminyldiphosphoundecaprenol N-acetyl-beta-D-mannosaminyltransferase